jgi:hypothetical protein
MVDDGSMQTTIGDVFSLGLSIERDLRKIIDYEGAKKLRILRSVVGRQRELAAFIFAIDFRILPSKSLSKRSANLVEAVVV